MSFDRIASPEIMEVVGILTWSFLLLAFLLGLFRRRLAPILKTAYLKTHIGLGAIGLAFGTFHAIVAILYY